MSKRFFTSFVLTYLLFCGAWAHAQCVPVDAPTPEAPSYDSVPPDPGCDGNFSIRLRAVRRKLAIRRTGR
jgi:hypothetical protein